MNDETQVEETVEENEEALNEIMQQNPLSEEVEELEAEEATEKVVLEEAELPEVEAPKVKVGDHKGIKETKEVLKLGFALAKAYKAANLDGKVNLLDAPLLVRAFPDLTAAFEGITEVPDEVKDLSKEEVAELLNFAAVHLSESSDDEKLVAKVEKSLAVGLAIVSLLKEF